MSENQTLNEKRELNLSPRQVKSARARPLSRKGQGAGFYEKVLNEAEKLDFDIAAGVDGIDDEIALLRVKMKQILEDNPKDIKLFIAATKMLEKLVKTRYSMNKKQDKSLGEAVKNIIKDIGVPLGITVMNKKL